MGSYSRTYCQVGEYQICADLYLGTLPIRTFRGIRLVRYSDPNMGNVPFIPSLNDRRQMSIITKISFQQDRNNDAP